jgi:aminoglycoside phosphotransferase (APT) family kinase protein
MAVLDVCLSDGRRRRVILRQPRPEILAQIPDVAQREFRLLEIVRAAGVPAPEPLYVDQSGDILATSFLVRDYIDGRPELSPQNPDDYLRQMAGVLATIHSIDGTGSDLAFLPRRAAYFGRLLAQPSAGTPEEEAIRTALAGRWPVTQLNRTVLLHGDFWPGNLLWRDGRLIAVVDWELGALGDPIEDLALARFDMALTLGIDAVEPFTRAYLACQSVDPTYLPVWDLCAALRASPDLRDWVSVYPPLGRPDITEDAARDVHRHFIKQALGALRDRGEGR